MVIEMVSCGHYIAVVPCSPNGDRRSQLVPRCILYFGDYNGEAIVPLLKFDKEINYICTEMNELAFEIIDGEGNAMEVEK